MGPVKLAFLLALHAPITALAYFETGNSLYKDLNSGDPVARIASMAYISGVADATRTEPNKKIAHCIPYGVTKGQIRDIVKLFMDNHPEYRHYVAPDVITTALAVAFPCKE